MEVEAGDNKNKIQKCRKCESLVSNTPDQMRSHVDKCTKRIPEGGSGKSAWNLWKLSCHFLQFSIVTIIVLKLWFAGTSGTGISPGLSQNKVGEFLIQTTAKEKKELDLLVAKFFYSCNIQFAAANDKDWLKLVSKLWINAPWKKGPCNLQAPYWTRLMMSFITKWRQKWRDAQDGWSNVHNSLILSHTMVVEGKSFLFIAVECGSATKEAKYCAEQLEKAIDEVKEFGGNPVCAVTDNCPTMVSMRGLLSENCPEMLFNGCSSHMLNCLSKDVSPQAQVNNIVEVRKPPRTKFRASLASLFSCKQVFPQHT